MPSLRWWRQAGVRDAARPGVAVRMLTSGTTGPPKRIDLTYDMLAHSVMGSEPGRSPTPTEVRNGVAIVNAPLVHIGGVFRVLQCVAEARPFALLDRFDLDKWADAVRRHRPRAVSLVPAALRMVLHSALRREDLDGVRAVTSGTAPLSAEDADAFQQKFGVPVLTSYAATEFGGGVAGWTLVRSSEVLAGQAGQRGTRQCRRPAAGGRRRRQPAGTRPAGAARGQAGSDGPVGGLAADHRRGPNRRRRLPVDPGPRRPGDHPRRLQGDARRCARRTGKPSRRAGRGRGRPSRRASRGNTGRRGRADARPRPSTPTSCSSSCETDWPATRFPARSRSSMPSPGRRRASRI